MACDCPLSSQTESSSRRLSALFWQVLRLAQPRREEICDSDGLLQVMPGFHWMLPSTAILQSERPGSSHLKEGAGNPGLRLFASPYSHSAVGGAWRSGPQAFSWQQRPCKELLSELTRFLPRIDRGFPTALKRYFKGQGSGFRAEILGVILG